MTRFIFFCMAFMALSFLAVPVFTGISKERDAILASVDSAIPASDSLSFEEIYKIAATNDSAENFDPSALNDIIPAAGGDTDDSFSSGFSYKEDSALENTTITLPDNEAIILE